MDPKTRKELFSELLNELGLLQERLEELLRCPLEPGSRVRFKDSPEEIWTVDGLVIDKAFGLLIRLRDYQEGIDGGVRYSYLEVVEE